MEIETITSVIGSLGFPIVACCFMGWYCVKLNDTLRELSMTIKELTTKFDDHVDHMES